MISTVQRIMHWQGMSKDIEEYVKNVTDVKDVENGGKSIVYCNLRLQRQYLRSM